MMSSLFTPSADGYPSSQRSSRANSCKTSVQSNGNPLGPHLCAVLLANYLGEPGIRTHDTLLWQSPRRVHSHGRPEQVYLF